MTPGVAATARRLGVLIAVAAAALASAPARAEARQAGTSPETASERPAPSAQVTAGWRDGFYLESDRGDFRLQIGALLHADGRFALGDDSDAVVDSFLIRRLRTYVRGRLAQRFEFYVNPDFAGGTLVVQDAYLDTVFAPSFRIRVGKAKAPVGFERLQSAPYTAFYERALPSAIAPNRDVGVQVLGDLRGGTVSYIAGVSNGAPDGGNQEGDTNDGKDVAGRVTVRPFARDAAHPLRGLSVGLGGSIGSQSGAGGLPAYRTAMLQQTFFSYSGAAADGVRTRYSPHVAYARRGFFGLFEYIHSQLPVREGAVSEDVAHRAWQVAGSWMLTGEAASDGSAAVKPKANFDFGGGHFGAWQLAARYHALSIDDRAIADGFAAPGASREAKAWAVAVNWYLTPNVRYLADFEHTVFDGGGSAARPAENALAFRTQVSF